MKAKYMHDLVRFTKKMSFFRCFVPMGGDINRLDDVLPRATAEFLRVRENQMAEMLVWESRFLVLL